MVRKKITNIILSLLMAIILVPAIAIANAKSVGAETSLSYGYADGYSNWSTTKTGLSGEVSQIFYKYSDQTWSSATETSLSVQYKYQCYKTTTNTNYNTYGSGGFQGDSGVYVGFNTTYSNIYRIGFDSYCHSVRGNISYNSNIDGYMCTGNNSTSGYGSGAYCDTSDKRAGGVNLNKAGNNIYGGQYNSSNYSCEKVGQVYQNHIVGSAVKINYKSYSTSTSYGSDTDWNGSCSSGYTKGSVTSTRSVNSETFYSYPLSYTVHFDKTTGEGEMSDFDASYTTAVSLPNSTFTKYGYHILGWSLTSDGETLILDGGKISADLVSATPGGEITLYAVWEPTVYTITYDLTNPSSSGNSGTNDSSNPKTYTIEDTPIVFANPIKVDYLFRGWYTDPDFTNQKTQIDENEIGDITLYAKFEQAVYKYSGSSFKESDDTTIDPVQANVYNSKNNYDFNYTPATGACGV